jgi:hypothetical protein
MTMKRTVLCIAFITFLVSCNCLYADEKGLRDQPGYIDLDLIEIPGNAGKVTEVDLGPGMLNLAAQMSDNGDEELSEKLSNTFSIQVKSFEIDSLSTEKLRPIVEKIEKKVEEEKWERILRVKEDNEIVNISVKYDEGKAVGLLVMAFEPGDEATFVNIVGSVDMSTLGHLMGMEGAALDSLKSSVEVSEKKNESKGSTPEINPYP